jgi:putative endonuclease
MYFVYVLHSLEDKKLYIGFTTDLSRRLAKHFQGEVEATRHRLPLHLIYYEAYCNKKDARGREKFLKGGSGHRYLKKQLKYYFNESP